MTRAGVDDIGTIRKQSSLNENMYTSEQEEGGARLGGQTDRTEDLKTDRPLIQNTHNVRRDGQYESSRTRAEKFRSGPIPNSHDNVGLN